MGARDQLGDAGGAARQLEQRGVARVDGDGVQIALRTFRRRLDQLGQRDEAFRRVAQHDGVLQVRRLGADAADHLGEAEIAVRVGRHRRHRLRRLHEEADLAEAVGRQGQHGDGADLLQREVEIDELDDVGHLHDQPVAGRDAEIEQVEREAGGAVVELAEADGAGRVAQRDAIGEALAPGLEHGAERLVAPIALGPVRRGERRRKRDDTIHRRCAPQLTKL